MIHHMHVTVDAASPLRHQHMVKQPLFIENNPSIISIYRDFFQIQRFIPSQLFLISYDIMHINWYKHQLKEKVKQT